MNLIDIENLPFADLKSRRAELIEQAARSTQADLAARFVDARTDAKHRDERMSEQGRTIASLNDGLDAKSHELELAKARVVDLEQQVQAYVREVSKFQEEVAAFKESLRVANRERDIATALSKSRRGALATVMQTIAPLLADEG